MREETYAQSEGRDLLHSIVDSDPEVEFDHEQIDQCGDIESWLGEMGYEWTGSGWLMTDD